MSTTLTKHKSPSGCRMQLGGDFSFAHFPDEELSYSPTLPGGKGIHIQDAGEDDHDKVGIIHLVGDQPRAVENPYHVHADKIHERNPVYPTQLVEIARRHHHQHREYIGHTIQICHTALIFLCVHDYLPGVGVEIKHQCASIITNGTYFNAHSYHQNVPLFSGMLFSDFSIRLQFRWLGLVLLMIFCKFRH